MTNLQQSLSKCRVEGNVLFLPGEHLDNYKEVRTALMNAGGKYSRNKFVFKGPAQPFIDRLMGGESVNIKKEFQFYQTPPELADRLVRLAQLHKESKILEPSAGAGNIMEAIHRDIGMKTQIDFCELMPENLQVLQHKMEIGKINGRFICNDFLAMEEDFRYHFIVANPPFTKGQDCDHVQKMYRLVHYDGFISTIMSTSWLYATNGKGKKFRDWLDDKNEVEDWHRFCNIGIDMQFHRANGDRVYIEMVDANTFKESGTSVRTCIIVIQKQP